MDKMLCEVREKLGREREQDEEGEEGGRRSRRSGRRRRSRRVIESKILRGQGTRDEGRVGVGRQKAEGEDKRTATESGRGNTTAFPLLILGLLGLLEPH